MSRRDVTQILHENVILHLPAKVRRLVAEQDPPLSSRLLTAFEISCRRGQDDGPDQQYEAADNAFCSSRELAIEVAAYIHTGELDHTEWDRVFAEVTSELGLAAELEAPSPTAFQEAFSNTGSNLSGIAATPLDLERQSRTPTLVADSVAGRNVVVGTQYIYSGPPTVNPAHLLPLRESYLRRLLGSLNAISLTGIDPRAASGEQDQISLREIYVHLEAIGGSTGQDFTLRFDGPAAHFITATSKSVILGEPGGGKSTLISFVALCLAGHCLGSSQFNLHALAPEGATSTMQDDSGRLRRIDGTWPKGQGLLPIRIVLRDFASFCLEATLDPNAQTLWRYIEEDLESASLAEYGGELRSELLKDGGVLLFDGLDEVPQSESQRERIVASIEDFAATFSKCKVVVTSRTHAYRQQGWRLRGFGEAELKDLSPVQIGEFVHLWYRDVARRSDATDIERFDGRASELTSAIHANASLLDLAVRPLLLTLMASLHAWRGGSLPEKREELYSDAVDLLLDTWESQRIKKLPDGRIVQLQPSLLEWLRCDRDAVRNLLEEIAYKAHLGSGPEGRETADIPEEELIKRLTKISGNPNARPLRLIEYLSQRAGIVIQRAPEVYAFPHRTFQEYLAACHLTENEYPESLIDLFAEDPAHWREVALLALAKASRGTSAAGYFTAQVACPDPATAQPTRADFRGAMLAAHALIGSGRPREDERAKKLADRVRSFLIQGMRNSDLLRPERVESGQLLGRLGDPRAGLTSLLDMEFCLVPSGKFHYVKVETTSETLVNEDSEEPEIVNVIRPVDTSEVEIAYDFWISRFPVTNAHFLEFIDAGGYEDPDLWKEAEAAGAWRPSEILVSDFEDWEDGDPSDEEVDEAASGEETTIWRRPPTRSDLENNLAEPVSEITWYEALAFCRWFSRTFDGSYRAALPSILEWDKAARGGYHVPPRPIVRDLKEILLSSGPLFDASTQVENRSRMRKYPWGNDSPTDTVAFSNLGSHTLFTRRRSGRAAPLPVGMHPSGESPYGVSDMVGNIWQHTRSLYRTSIPTRATVRECSEGMLADRLVLRSVRGGGSWVDADTQLVGYELPTRANEEFVTGLRLVLLSRSD